MNRFQVDQESDDLFASDDESLRDSGPVTIGSMQNGDYENDDDEDDQGSKMSAAAALTTLVATASLQTKLHPSAIAEYDDDDDDEEIDDREIDIPQRFTKSGRKRAVPFPIKLMMVLSNKKFNEIITWTPSGKSFNIVKPKLFVTDILPSVFKSAKYSSFTRKLHRWGFMRHYRGEEAGAYHHELFMKDRLDLVEQMTCHKQEPVRAKVSVHEHKVSTKVTPLISQSSANISCSASISRDALSAATANLSINSHSMLQPSRQALLSSQPSCHIPASVNVDAHRVDLNTAIELEVARRLKERLESASYSHQALALLQQQQQFRAQQQIQAQQQQAYENVRLLLAQAPTPQPQLSRLQSPQMLELAQLYNKIKARPLQQYMAFGSASISLPATNIQGAKTA